MTFEKAQAFWKSGHSNAPLPPLAPGLPVLGSALEMNKDVLGFLVRTHRQLGPIFRVRVLNPISNSVVITNVAPLNFWM